MSITIAITCRERQAFMLKRAIQEQILLTLRLQTQEKKSRLSFTAGGKFITWMPLKEVNMEALVCAKPWNLPPCYV